MGSIPGSGRSPGVGNDNLLQYSCLENSMDRRAWRATVQRVAKRQTWLSDWAHSVSTTTLCKLGFFPHSERFQFNLSEVWTGHQHLKFFFTAVIVDLQCCVSFRCTAKWICYTYTWIHPFLSSFSHVGHYRVFIYFWLCWVFTAACGCK